MSTGGAWGAIQQVSVKPEAPTGLMALVGLASGFDLHGARAASHTGEHGNVLFGKGHRYGPAKFVQARHHSL